MLHCHVVVTSEALAMSRYVELCSALMQLKQAVWEAATICPRPCDLDLWSFDLESGVKVTRDVGYLLADFSLPRPLCSRLRPDIRDRQTSDSIIA